MQESRQGESVDCPAIPAVLPAPAAPARGNVLRHDASVISMIDGLVGADSYARMTAALRDELKTSGPLQEALVGRIAHHLAALELSRQAELGALREGAHQAMALNVGETALAANAVDAELSAAVSSEILGRIAGYGRGHERGLLAALDKLHELRNARALGAPRPLTDFGPRSGHLAVPFAAASREADAGQPEADRFADDAVCEAYLERRIRGVNYRCPECSAARGYWLERRRRWECQQCRKQAGPRTGTVMAGSPLRLSVWFAAIKIVVTQCDASVAEVAAQLRLGRLPTVRAMLRKIRAALASADRSCLLAGLDRVFSTAEPETTVPETSVSAEKFLGSTE